LLIFPNSVVPLLDLTYGMPILFEISNKMGHYKLDLEVTKEAHLLFKVINERYNREKSLIFTTNVEEHDWAEFMGDPFPHGQSSTEFFITPYW